MNICHYIPTKYLDDKGYNARLRYLFKQVCYLQATGTGTVSSVGLSMPSAFTVTNSPITSSGTLAVTGAGTTSQYIRGDGSLATYGTATAVPISGLTAAVATNTINNGDYIQEWDWNSLAANSGLYLYSNSTLLSGSLFQNKIEGVNSSANRTTVVGSFQNIRTGTTSTNIGVDLSVSGASTNIALNAGRGSVNIGTVGAETGTINMRGGTAGTLTIKPPASVSSYTWTYPSTGGTSGYVLTTDGSGGTTFTNPTSIVTATPTLQQVTTAGNTTTDDITFSSAYPSRNSLTWTSNGGTDYGQLTYAGNTGNYTWTLPNANGIIPISVNGNAANSSGAIVISSGAGSGTVTGTGTSGQGTYWNGTSSVTGGTGFLYDGSGTITLTTALTSPTVRGSTAANGDLLIDGTSSATKATSYVDIQQVGGYVGINTGSSANNLAIPLHIGESTYSPAVDPVILINRNITNAGSGNAHAFVDASYVIRDGSIGYASYDAFPLISGTSANYDHFAAFQSRPIYNNPGFTIGAIYGTYTYVTNTAGTITSDFGHYASNGVNTGTIGTKYGYYSEALTTGSTNYAFYSAGTTPSVLNGQLTLARAGAASTPSTTLTGAMYSGGSATTTKPLLLIEPSGATTNTWSTAGGLLGVNTSGYTGYQYQGKANGVTSFGMSVTAAGGFADLQLGSYVADGVNGMAGRVRFYRYEGTEAGQIFTTSGANLAISGTNAAVTIGISGTNGINVTTSGTWMGKQSISNSTATALVHIAAGSTAASSAPLKFTSGALNTTAEVGAVEFLTDAWYGTITTGAARKTFAFLESPTFTGLISVPHIKGNSSTPSIAGGSGAGTAPTVSITGTDLAGEITVTTDTDPSTGNIFCTVTFATAFSSAPYVVIYPSNDNAIIDLTKFQAGLYVTSTTTTFVLNTNSITAPTISSEMKFMYHVIQ